MLIIRGKSQVIKRKTAFYKVASLKKEMKFEIGEKINQVQSRVEIERGWRKTTFIHLFSEYWNNHILCEAPEKYIKD